jgi:hypothetical protein
LERVHLGRRRADRPIADRRPALRGGFPWLEQDVGSSATSAWLNSRTSKRHASTISPAACVASDARKQKSALCDIAAVGAQPTVCCGGAITPELTRRRTDGRFETWKIWYGGTATCTSAPSPGRTGMRARTGRRSGNGLAASIRSIATNASEAMHGNLTHHAPAWPGAHGFGRAVYLNCSSAKQFSARALQECPELNISLLRPWPGLHA